MTRAPAVVLAALLTASCGASLMKLPKLPPASGSGVASSDARDALAAATAACRAVSTISAEVAASGSVGGQRLRARLVAGLAPPASARLEAYAFGQPMFVLVASETDATLLLQRDNRILEHGHPESVLEAIAGVPLGPADLRTTLTGCPSAPNPDQARQPAEDWRVIPDRSGFAYLHRTSRTAPWILVAATRRDGAGAEWQVDYDEVVAGLPHRIHLASLDRKRFDLRLQLSQVETNLTFGPDVFRLRIPPSADPITLDELRKSGPLGTAAANGPEARPSR